MHVCGYDCALRPKRLKTKKERQRFLLANPDAPWFPGKRSGSDSSLQSNLSSSIVPKRAKRLAAKIKKLKNAPNVKLQSLIPDVKTMPMMPAYYQVPIMPSSYFLAPMVPSSYSHASMIPSMHCPAPTTPQYFDRHFFKRKKVNLPFTVGIDDTNNSSGGFDQRLISKRIQSSLKSTAHQENPLGKFSIPEDKQMSHSLHPTVCVVSPMHPERDIDSEIA